MTKTKRVSLNKATTTALAGLATIVAANLMSRLYSRGIINDEDVASVLTDTASGGLGDAATDAMAKALADSLADQFAARMN